MKRLTLLLALTLVLVLGVSATAYAANPPGTYKLTITVYWDVDSDAVWDECEPILPNVIGWVWRPDGTRYPDFKTDCCGWAKVYLPIGATIYAKPTTISPWPVDKFPAMKAYTTEHTPDAPEYSPLAVAKVVMRGNRCMLFGVGPVPYAAPDCSCPPTQECEPCNKVCACPSD